MFTTARDKNTGMAEDTMANEGGQPAHDVKDAMHRLKGDAQDGVTAAKDNLEDVARRTGRHMRDLADSAGHNVTDVAGVLTAKIRDNPLQASMITLGIGFVVGMLYRR